MTKTNLFDLSGKLALVTGCRRGIGRAMAVGLAEAGADVIGVSARMEGVGSAVQQEIETLGRRFFSYACEFSDRAAVHAFAGRVLADHPRIDILVNNAGTTARHPATDFPDDDWDRVLEINLNAQFVLAREIGRTMVARGAGKIIFTASLLSYQGGITVPAYAASKGALATLTMALANEWAARGVNVNALAPGYVRTDVTDALQKDPVRSRQILERIPAGRWGDPDDFKGPIVFLASEASRYMHGAVLLVDGGWLGR
jgi:2-deoxy-D-gluconate 3-dehydrogenase